MAKKSNGEGTTWTEKRNGKNYYRGQICTGFDDNGKKIIKSFSSFSKTKLNKKMDEYKYKLNAGILSIDTEVNLQDYCYVWLFEYKKIELKPSSFARYEGIYRNYIKGTSLAKIPIVELKTIHFQKFINEIALSKTISTAKSVKKTIVSCLNYALKEDIIMKNYCSFVTLPKEPPKDKYLVFTTNEQQEIINSLDNSTYDMAILLSFGTGLRLGELIALKWTDLDFFNKTITVNKALKQVNVVNDDGTRSSKLLMQTPKTESSYRTIPIPPIIIEKLKEYYNKQASYISMLKKAYNNQEFIFTDAIGLPLEPRVLPRHYKKILDKLEIPYRNFHSIRHSYATRLFEASVPVKTVQALLGHSDITTTMNIYTHVMPEEKTKAADSINHLFDNKSVEPVWNLEENHPKNIKKGKFV